MCASGNQQLQVAAAQTAGSIVTTLFHHWPQKFMTDLRVAALPHRHVHVLVSCFHGYQTSVPCNSAYRQQVTLLTRVESW